MKRYGKNSVRTYSDNYLNLIAMMFLVLLMTLCGCSTDQWDQLDKSELPAFGVNPTTLTLSAGETKTVQVSGGVSPYRISSADASVAKIELKDSVVNITGVAKGTTSFTIYDGGRDSSQNKESSQVVYVTVNGADKAYSLSDTGNKVLLGPVENADISAYRLSDLKNAIETTRTGEKGAFTLKLSDIDDSELLLVSAAGGQDIDADDDGVSDQTPTPNTGMIHALATAKDIRDGKLTVSLISEMAWQYSKNQIGDTHPEDLKIRLRDISRVLFKQRIDDTSDVFQDITKFNPLSRTHRNKLNFDYANLLKENSLSDTIHKGLEVSVIQGAVEPVVGNALSFNDGKSQTSQYGKIRLLPFGKGKVSASSGHIGYDAKDRTKDSLSDFYLIGDTFILRAENYEETHIDSWTGCDKVSDDKKECTLTVLEDTMIGVNFASDKVVFSDKTVDLSNAITEIDSNEINYRIKAKADDTETANKLTSLKAGNYIISSQDPFYAREVINVSQSGDTYTVETKDVDITQVIQKGTGVLRKTLTHADLVDFSESSATRSSKRSPYSPGQLQLLPPKDLNDDTFVFSFGEPQKKNTRGNVSVNYEKGESMEVSHTFKTESGIEIVVSGSVEVKFDIDAALEYDWFDVKAIKVIPKVTLTEGFNITFKEKTKLFKDKFRLGAITFARQPIGVIGWITYDAELFLVIECDLEGKAEIKTKFVQTAVGGIKWDEVKGKEWVSDFKSSWEPPEENINVKLTAKAYFEITPSVLLYSTVGPAIPINVGVKGSVEAKINANINDVTETLSAVISLFASAKANIKIKEHYGIGWLADKIKDKLANATEIEVFAEASWQIKKWEIHIGSIGDQPAYLKVLGGDAIQSFKSYEKNTLPDTIAEYTLTNTGDKTLTWDIETKGKAFEDTFALNMPGKKTLAKGENAVVKLIWNPGFSKQSLGNGTIGGTIRFVNRGRDTYPDFQTGTTQKQVRIAIEEGTPPLETLLPDSCVAPIMGSFDASPQKIQVNCPRAEKIYCLATFKTDGSDPDRIIVTPDALLHTPVNKNGDEYISGDSGQFEIWAEPNQVKKIKVRFRGCNKYGCGATTGTYIYTIDLSNGNGTLPTCTYSINPTSSTLASSGGTGSVSVTASGGCNWNASSNADWIKIDSGASGNVNGTVNYSVASYSGTGSRTGTLTIAGQIFTVTQSNITADFGNSLGMSFKLIPTGTFIMGSPENDIIYAADNEKPQHQVTISKGFYIQITEVTQGQWKAVMGSNPSYFTACGDNCPVEQVSWNDAQAFIVKMNQRGEGTYRLPTEAEWEYAARAGSTTAFPNGGITTYYYCIPIDSNLDAMGWYCGNSGYTTHPVQGKQANTWGLYDMHGNVWEWVEDDWYGGYSGAPTDGSAWVASPRSSYRVLRGGGLSHSSWGCRSAYRGSYSPGSRGYDGGFRLVREQ